MPLVAGITERRLAKLALRTSHELESLSLPGSVALDMTSVWMAKFMRNSARSCAMFIVSMLNVFDAVEPGDNIVGGSTIISMRKERFLRRPGRVAADDNTTIERVGAPSSISMKTVNNRRDEDVRMHACCRYNILNYHRYLYLLSTVIKSNYFQHQEAVLVQLQITRNVVHE
jgi:hypothetical protein